MTLETIAGAGAASLAPLAGRTVAVLGYGNQGAAHALNLRDSGVEVVVANRSHTMNGRRATDDGFPPRSIPEAVDAADLIIVALPDDAHGTLWPETIAPHLRPSAVVGFLHGFSLRYGLIAPPPDVGVVLVAPKGPGATLRARYVRGQGIPCLFATHQPANDAEAVGLAWAAGIGCARAAVVRTTVADETETDLFGEQAVLCGGMTSLIRAAFETLVEAGYPPELAYMECCQEVKQVADLVYTRGLAGMMAAISDTAEFGAYHAGPQLVDDAVRERMHKLLEAIRDGDFAGAFVRAGAGGVHGPRAALAADGIEAAGRAVRAWMPWLEDEGG